MNHLKIVRRHRLVDFGFIITGAFLSAAIQVRSLPYLLASVAIGGLTFWIDNKNVSDEEDEIQRSRQ